jgi:hypothetical protein
MSSIPVDTERAIELAVGTQLREKLGQRGLLVLEEHLASAEREAVQLGDRLLAGVVRQCYPAAGDGTGAVSVEFDGVGHAARVHAALAFGSQTARMFGRVRHGRGPPAHDVELLGAIFNLGIGLVDGLCDGSPQLGSALLELMCGCDLVAAAEDAPPRGWLSRRLPRPLAHDLASVFAADLIEAFFALLNDAYPGDAWLHLRRRLGAQLTWALQAECQSVLDTGRHTSRKQLIECSRRTSVLPFEIIETLATGASGSEPSAATLLGEAMWRVDDLVDLCEDVRGGALNGFLLAASEVLGLEDATEQLSILERLPYCGEIERAAEQAAGNLLTALQLVAKGRFAAEDHLSILSFVQRYTGIAPAAAS